MKTAVWQLLFKIIGWKTDITVEWERKCVICVAPHTSNFDFIIGLLAYRSLGRKANFLMKDFWFFFPLKYILTALGGIPVKRGKTGKDKSLTREIVNLFAEKDYINLAVTPEGTRKATEYWHTGFLRIATEAHVAIHLAVIDYKQKTVVIKKRYIPTGDINEDLSVIRKYYSGFKLAARYPEKFKV